MDPDATLARIRKALAEREQADTDETANQAAHEAADAAEALVGWLARGGFPPDWKKV